MPFPAIRSLALYTLATAFTLAASAETIMVTSAGNADTPGTLRNAILQASSNADAIDVILIDNDALPPGTIITPSGNPLPPLPTGLTIVGGNAVLDGSLLDFGSGLQASGNNIVVSDLTIVNFPGFGVELNGNDNRLLGCRIGTDGQQLLSNIAGGVYASGEDILIGGTTVANRNLIADDDVAIQVERANNVRILNNYINFNETGRILLGMDEGIDIGNSDIVTVGEPGLGNLIGAAARATALRMNGGVDHTVQANLFGLNIDRDAVAGRAQQAIRVASSVVAIGGVNPGEGNVIATAEEGIEVGSTASNVAIRGNALGIDPDSGTVWQDGTGEGIEIIGPAREVTIGGTVGQARNTITGWRNGIWRNFAGVDSTGQNVAIRANSIYGNVGRGIRFASPVPEVDTTLRVPAPRINAYNDETGFLQATVTGNNIFGEIDFYLDDLDEGRIYLGTADVNFGQPDNAGSITVDPAMVGNQRITAIWTTSFENSSPFSAPANGDLFDYQTLFVPSGRFTGFAFTWFPLVGGGYRRCVDPDGGRAFSSGFTVEETFTSTTGLPTTIDLPAGKTFNFFGEEYSQIGVSAAGVLTPGGTVPDGADDSEASHFAVPRISVLAQNASGLSELVYGFNDNSLFVQWDGFTPDQSFGVTRVEARLYFDGQIDVRLLEKNEFESILGLSNGGGIPADYAPSRFEDSVTCGAPPCYANCEQTCARGGLNPSIDDAQVAVYGQPLYTVDFLPFDGMDDGTHAQLVQAILLDDRLSIHCCVRNAYEDNAAVFDALTDSQMTTLRDAFPFSDTATPAETRTFFAWFYTVALEPQRRDLQRTVAQDLDVDLPRGNDSAVRFVAANGDADADGDCNVSEYLEAVSPPLDDQTANAFVVNALDFSTADGDGASCIACFEPSDAVPQQRVHAADPDGDNAITLSELLRVIQFFNSGGLHCAQPAETTEDGFVPARDMAEESCAPHSSDYAPQDWQVSLSELLRLIQFFNSGGYTFCPSDGTEDGFCPGPPAP